jgi:lipopolysaccharide/colanic/teichoic acid biosynthesis glycosyltransferase
MHKYSENKELYEKSMTSGPRGGYSPLSALISRAFNLSLALLLTLLSIPAFLIISAMIKLQDGGAVIYKGIRLGMNKKPFTMYKFRTLIPDAELEIGAELLSHKHRIVTKSGKFLRDTRLDELLQLFNIIKGDMDFLGPRPERQAIYEKYCKDIQGYDKRFMVRPGIVGYSQLFTPHGTPKKIRALIDNHFLLKKRRLSWEIYQVLKMVIAINMVIASKMVAYVWNSFIKQKILKLHHHEKRVLERIKVFEGKVFVGRQAKGKDYSFSTCAKLKDINEEAFSLYTNDKITREYDVFWLAIDHVRTQCKRVAKRKMAWCYGEVYKELQLNDKPYKYSYIVKYIPRSPLNAYIIDQYFLRKSILRHKIICNSLCLK